MAFLVKVDSAQTVKINLTAQASTISNIRRQTHRTKLILLVPRH
jgi:hypothetical protein